MLDLCTIITITSEYGTAEKPGELKAMLSFLSFIIPNCAHGMEMVNSGPSSI